MVDAPRRGERRDVSVEARIRHRTGAFTLDVAFVAPAGGVTALFGPSGSGKTSIVHALAGLTRPQHGRIVIAGKVVLDTEENIFIPAERRRTGMVFQDARLFPHMSVEDNLLFGWRRAPHRVDADEIARLVTLLGLELLLRRAPRHLSGGEKARVALGRALLASPQILLLDEPLASLDAERRQDILPWLERLRDIARLPMIYVSHAADEVARLADKIVLLREGRVVAEGSAFDLLTGLGNPSGVLLGALIDTVVVGTRPDGLTELAFDGGRLAAPVSAQAGRSLRVRIAAEDILIARGEPKGISANNILKAKVTEFRYTQTLADVELAAGAARLVARITAASASRLELAAGTEVFAIIKSMAVDRGEI
jgi:molybdate transport system ATP-binding protein